MLVLDGEVVGVNIPRNTLDRSDLLQAVREVIQAQFARIKPISPIPDTAVQISYHPEIDPLELTNGKINIRNRWT